MTRSIGGGGGGSESVFDGDAKVSPWKDAGTLPKVGTNMVAVEYNGSVYVRFGSDSNGRQTDFYKYDPSDDSITTLASGIEARDDYGAVVDGSTIYVFGGVNASGAVQAEAYDIAADSWSQITIPFTGPLYPGTSVAKLGDRILVAGNDSSTGKRTDIYDPSNDSWTTTNDAPSDVSGGSAVTVPGDSQDTVYVMDSSGQLYTYANFVGWTTLSTSISPGGQSAVYDGSHIWYMGGANGFEPSNSVTKFDPSAKETVDAPPLPSELAYPAATIADGEIHLFGGGISTFSDGVLRYDSGGRGTIATGEGALYALGANNSGAELINTETGQRGDVILGRDGDGITLSKNGYAQVYKV